MEYLKVNHQKRTILAPQAGKKKHKKPILLALRDNTAEKNKDLKVGSLSALQTVDDEPACSSSDELLSPWGGILPGPWSWQPCLAAVPPPGRCRAGSDLAMGAFAEASRLRPVPEDRRPWGADAGRTGHMCGLTTLGSVVPPAQRRYVLA